MATNGCTLQGLNKASCFSVRVPTHQVLQYKPLAITLRRRVGFRAIPHDLTTEAPTPLPTPISLSLQGSNLGLLQKKELMGHLLPYATPDTLKWGPGGGVGLPLKERGRHYRILKKGWF